MGLPELNGDPCWVFVNGPFDLAKRNAIRMEAGDRRFVRIIKPYYPGQPVPIFEFDK